MKPSEFLQKLKNLDQNNLRDVKGLGEVLINNIQEFISSERYSQMLHNFQKLEETNLGPNIISTNIEKIEGPLSGQVICITGTFEISRDEISKKLSLLGAKISSAVTSSTTILLAGEKAGSKLSKAENLGTRVVTDYKELLELPNL
jgi:DNA ligase (NAD+)